MHARVSTITGSPDQADAGISDFREKVMPWIKEQGGRGGILLLDRETGKAIAVTLWSDEEAMRQSEEAANEHRRRVSDEMQSAESPIVERYEVAVFEV
jgi:heme-degrading monooxygenase HmoA